MWDFIKAALPTDTSGQTLAVEHVKGPASDVPEGGRILDLGCGDGRSLELFESIAPGRRWTGVDIESSPEVDARSRADGDFHAYDGRVLPFADASMDLVFSNQVFEHVEDPPAVMREVARVLRPGSLFVGSTSQLEPYHSFSTYNYTVYGFALLVRGAGLDLEVVRPGIDGITLTRRALGEPGLDRFFREESPVNADLEAEGRAKGWTVQQRAFRKLVVAGQFVFTVRRPA